MKLLLASQSPRRKELLQKCGFQFDVVSIDCDESYPENLPTEEIPAYISLQKAKAYKHLNEEKVLITADTIVALGDEVLGKPKNEEHAFQMLSKLSGRSHEVYTGVTIRTFSETITRTDKSTVFFDEISEKEILFYIENFKPLDKAGSYGIQDWIGLAKIKKIEGSFYTIMGLPTHLIYRHLKNILQKRF